MRYNPDPPYNVRATDRIDFATMQRLSRFSRYWDLVANSGRFRRTLPLMLGGSPFARFLAFSDWLSTTAGQTHQIAIERLVAFVYRWLVEHGDVAEPIAADALAQDYMTVNPTGRPSFLPPAVAPSGANRTASPQRRGSNRQARHLTDILPC